MTTPSSERQHLHKVAPSTGCSDVDLSARRLEASPNGDGDTDLGTVAIVPPRVSEAVARALTRSGFFLVADTGSCQVWVRHPGQRL